MNMKMCIIFLNNFLMIILYLSTDKPEIATHPQNITTREGQNVTLYCNATGNPVPTISWYKNAITHVERKKELERILLTLPRLMFSVSDLN